MNCRNASEPKSLALVNRTGQAQRPYGFVSPSWALGALVRHFPLLESRNDCLFDGLSLCLMSMKCNLQHVPL